MNTTIRAFVQALEGVFMFLRDNVFSGVQAQAEVAWENFDNWLIDHGYTLPQLIGYFFFAIGGLLALGLGMDMVGLAFGTVGHETTARFFITVGTLIGLLGLLPLFFVANTVKGFFNLIVHCGEAACELLDADTDSHLPARIRQQLQLLRNRPDYSFTLKALYAAFAAVSIVFCIWPNFYSMYFSVVAGVAVSGIMTLRQLMGVKGHGIKKLTMAGAYGFAGGSIVYAILAFVGRPIILSAWPNLASGTLVEQLTVLSATLAALITFLILLNMRIADEEKEIRNGDVPIRPYELEVVEVDPATGIPTRFAAHSKQPFSWKWLKSRTLWGTVAAVVLVAGLFVWTQVLGHPMPGADMDLELLVLLVLALFGYAAFGSSEEKKA